MGEPSAPDRPLASPAGLVSSSWYGVAGIVAIGIVIVLWGALKLGIIPQFALGASPRHEVELSHATVLYRSGNYATAVDQLRAIAGDAGNESEQWLITYWLANSLAAQGEYEQSISVLKEAAARRGASARTRALAVQEMGVQYYRSNDERVTMAIFDSAPYSALFVADDIPRSYRQLFEYASSIHELALAQLYVADWYADAILLSLWEEKSGVRARGSAQGERAQYRAQVKAALDHADAQIADSTASGEDSYGTLLSTLAKRAVVLGKMSRAGYTTFADPVAAFDDVLARHAKLGLTNDGAVRVQYAIFLARKYKDARAHAIRAILAPIYSAPDHRSPVIRNTAVALIGKDTDFRSRYALVATYDPKFEALLRSFGWTDDDFAAAQ